MTASPHDPTRPRTPAFPLRAPGPRMDRRELTELFYQADLSAPVTPAESLPAPEPSTLSFARNWTRMSGFGRWTPC